MGEPLITKDSRTTLGVVGIVCLAALGGQMWIVGSLASANKASETANQQTNAKIDSANQATNARIDNLSFELRELRTVTTNMQVWTKNDHVQWVLQFARMNPTIKVPEDGR